MTTSVATAEERRLSATAERFCRRFSLAEIQFGTQDFSEAHLIGKGGFGKVYKGQIDEGQQTVAMKRLAPNSNQGEGEFLTEIETLSKLRHINLVSLIGYCDENGEMILVYEYIPRGTLADHLYKLSGSSKNDCSPLTWKQRLNICIGAARGIEYLHTGSAIIHRDVKSTNILLDENFKAKVSDFGLAKHLSSSDSNCHVSTLVKGTIGYLDPNYLVTGRLTRNSDTYAFGVVLLEVLSGTSVVDIKVDERGLVAWAKEKIGKGKADQIVASNLRDEISADCLKIFVGVAKRCLHRDPQKRPTMGEAVIELQLASKQQERKATTPKTSRFLPLFNRFKLSESRATGSTQQEHKHSDVSTLSTAIPDSQEEALIDEQTVNMLPVAVPAIPIHELEGITHNFSSECFIDHKISGGNVYRGTLKSGQDAAIKELCYSSLSGEEFLEQVSLVSSLEHVNIALLLGYCVDGRRNFLVYEFAQNGSLYDILRGFYISKPFPVLSWGQRVKIAVGLAKGLEYIHEKAQIHCNIRSSNILVYNDEVSKLADFGLSARYAFKRLDDCSDYYPFFRDRPHDYHSPEYIRNGKLSWRSDVYSFGLVLLELLTGRTVMDATWPRGQQHLLTWAGPRLSEDKVNEVVDARLNGDYPPMAVAKMAAVAALCVQKEDESRPNMCIVVKALRPLLKKISATETQN